MFNRLLSLLLISLLFASLSQAQTTQLFIKQQFTEQDAVLVTDQQGQVVYAWQADKLLVPASLTKLLTSYLAIDKWGLSHRFNTDFYLVGTQLWVKGYGDPYLVSEEIDLIVNKLKEFELAEVKSIHIDASYFVAEPVPGSSSVSDPYNAPLSAVGANFNTTNVEKKGDTLISAEPQTPLTATAKKLIAARPGLLKRGNKVRVNLINSDNAQMHFAEVLAIKLGMPSAAININQTLPAQAQRLYRHLNTHALEQVLTGSMKYSNNFIANQVFIKLAEEIKVSTLNFKQAQTYVADILQNTFAWQGATVLEGAGLSRSNKLTAKHIDHLLEKLLPYKPIFKQITNIKNANVYAKTGTLNGVSNYAGYIGLPEQKYRFVFMFNRSTPYGYRDQVLTQLVQQLSVLEQP